MSDPRAILHAVVITAILGCGDDATDQSFPSGGAEPIPCSDWSDCVDAALEQGVSLVCVASPETPLFAEDVVGQCAHEALAFNECIRVIEGGVATRDQCS